MKPRFHIPEGHRPEEFLRDAELAEYHAEQLEQAGKDHPDLAELTRNATRARVAAALTAQSITEATLAAEAEVNAATDKPKKG